MEAFSRVSHLQEDLDGLRVPFPIRLDCLVDFVDFSNSSLRCAVHCPHTARNGRVGGNVRRWYFASATFGARPKHFFRALRLQGIARQRGYRPGLGELPYVRGSVSVIPAY